MKIGIIAPGIWDTVFIDMATTLALQGHEVAVYTDDARAPSGRNFLRLREHGVDFYVIHGARRNPFLWPLDKLGKPFLGRRFFTTLSALYRYFQATSDRDVYLVEGDWMGVFVALIRRVRRFRWVVGVHDTENLNIAIDYPGRQNLFWMQRAKLWVFSSCEAVRANSFVTRDALVEGGVSAEKIKVIPLHIPENRLPREELASFRPRAREEIFRRYNLPTNTRLLMVMCRLAPVKGLELALEALPQILETYPETRLMICGPDRDVPGLGSYRGALENLAQSLRVADKLVFTGNLDIPELRLYQAAADLHLAPSLIDTFSYSVIDAAMAGTRSLVSDKVGVAYWMLQAGAGVVVPQRDPALWARAIMAELAAPPSTVQMAGFVRELSAVLDCGKISAELAGFFAEVVLNGAQRGGLKTRLHD